MPNIKTPQETRVNTTFALKLPFQFQLTFLHIFVFFLLLQYKTIDFILKKSFKN